MLINLVDQLCQLADISFDFRFKLLLLGFVLSLFDLLFLLLNLDAQLVVRFIELGLGVPNIDNQRLLMLEEFLDIFVLAEKVFVKGIGHFAANLRDHLSLNQLVRTDLCRLNLGAVGVDQLVLLLGV